jgi:hypothetical protein
MLPVLETISTKFYSVLEGIVSPLANSLEGTGSSLQIAHICQRGPLII